MATLVTCQDISKAYGLRELFASLSISFEDNERIGFIGPNGAGKTTFLKIVAGLEPADSGAVNRRRSARIVYLPQQDQFSEDVCATTALLEATDDLNLQLHERDTLVNTTLTQFGFDGAQQVHQMSGGWRKRLALARATIRQPDLLLMDEPTNHLDLEGIVWLEDVLARATFAFVAVSHDRYFLEHVTNRVVELNATYRDGYFSSSGPYSAFLKKRADFLEAQQAQQATLANIVRREAAFLESNAKARRTKSKSRIEEAHRLQDELRDLQRRNNSATTAGIDFDSTGRKSRKLIEAQGLSKALGGRTLFKDLSLLLSPGSRVGLMGDNGSGKTTLIRVLSAALAPDEGTIKRADGLKIVLFDQKREHLPQDLPVRVALSAESESIDFRGQRIHITAWAKRFLFRIDQLDLPVRELSGGAQARILVARLMLQPADILILDEPTNDLDIDSLDVLEYSLGEFPGAVVLVTHDRFMLDRVCTEIIGLDGTGGVERFGDSSQWLAAQARRATQASAALRPERSGKRAQRGPLSASEKKDLQTIEETILEAEAHVETCREAFNGLEQASDHIEAQQRWDELEAARTQVEALYTRWEELETKARGGP
jgi:ATP-binding cassette subfamily F protein uup